MACLSGVGALGMWLLAGAPARRLSSRAMERCLLGILFVVSLGTHAQFFSYSQSYQQFIEAQEMIERMFTMRELMFVSFLTPLLTLLLRFGHFDWAHWSVLIIDGSLSIYMQGVLVYATYAGQFKWGIIVCSCFWQSVFVVGVANFTRLHIQ